MIINENGPANVPETTTDRFLAGKNNLQSFLDEVELPKEEFQIPETPNIQDTHTDSGGKSDTDSPPVDAAATAKAKKASAELICATIDSLFSGIASAFAGTDDIIKFKATVDERRELANAWYEYTKTLNYDMPPWFVLLMLNSAVYGTKIPIARREFKKNKMAKKAEEKTEPTHEPDEKENQK